MFSDLRSNIRALPAVFHYNPTTRSVRRNLQILSSELSQDFEEPFTTAGSQGTPWESQAQGIADLINTMRQKWSENREGLETPALRLFVGNVLLRAKEMQEKKGRLSSGEKLVHDWTYLATFPSMLIQGHDEVRRWVGRDAPDLSAHTNAVEGSLASEDEMTNQEIPPAAPEETTISDEVIRFPEPVHLGARR